MTFVYFKNKIKRLQEQKCVNFPDHTVNVISVAGISIFVCVKTEIHMVVCPLPFINI